jgi:glycosyltransferase involved in cell wall biosynthesis
MIYSTPLVSIAMATYNGASYIAQQLNSLLKQTYPNLEIIVTDDASTDGTLAILENFKNKHDNIKIFNNATNQGITYSFEHSIRNCSGDFIAISDQDDIWELTKIEVLLSAMKNEDVIYSDSELVDKNGQPLNKLISSLVNLGSFKSGVPFLMGICLPGHTMLLQGDFARYILPIPPVIMYDRWISFCAASNNGIKYFDQPLVKYRQHETNYFGVGISRNNKKRKTKNEKYFIKLLELKACEKAPVKDAATQKILHEMLTLFTQKISLARSLFFFKNRNTLLSIKKKSGFRKILYCLKMFFKANY